ncbi:hypothetical protein niasHT_015616 [Heterodera trifolii]|uniref:NR LBD domain-containing protein n=1 Tax=Heterodera trifolii TaxID=157864 RepID=A0ABD2LCG7_9BILA
MFASDEFASVGLNLLFNPSLFLNKFREIEPDKYQFPKFSLPIQRIRTENGEIGNELATTSSYNQPFLQSKEFFDSLANLWQRTMAHFGGVCDQFALLPPPRLLLSENPFDDFVAIVEDRMRMHQSAGVSVGIVPSKWVSVGLTIAALIAAERRIQKFNATLRIFNEGVLEQFDSLKELLQFERSFVSEFDEFTTPVPSLDEETMHTTDNLFTLLKMDFVTFVELFKMQPVFVMLEVDDQVRLVNSLAVSLLGLCERYHSSRWKAETVLKLSNGFCPIFIFYKNEQFFGSAELRKANLVYCRTMRSFNRVQPTIEEYLLLRAIAMSHSAFDGLSAAARRLLQNEAEHYADALLRFVQAQHGDAAGAKRYAELLELIEGVFYVADNQRKLHSILKAKTIGGGEAKMPKPFSEMCFKG